MRGGLPNAFVRAKRKQSVHITDGSGRRRMTMVMTVAVKTVVGESVALQAAGLGSLDSCFPLVSSSDQYEMIGLASVIEDNIARYQLSGF